MAMNSFKVTFADGNVIYTDMNATLAEAREYYVGTAFQFGDRPEHPKDKLVKAVSVDQLISCTCGNPDYGFDCVCVHVANNPGDTEYSCGFCGIYNATKPRCNKCEASD